MLTKARLYHLHTNHSILVTNQGINFPLIITFFDNFNIFTPYKSGIISYIKSKLTMAFEIIDMGPLVFYLGLKVT